VAHEMWEVRERVGGRDRGLRGSGGGKKEKSLGSARCLFQGQGENTRQYSQTGAR